MSGLRTKLQQRKKDAFFGAKVDRVLLSSVNLRVDRLKREFTNFYDIAEQYLEKWFNFSESGHLFNIQCFNLKEKQEISYRELTAAVSALQMHDELDLDELYNESCVLKEILPHLEIHSHPVGALWAQALRSTSAFPQYAKLLSFILSIPVSNAYSERVFSIMKGAWTDVRNRCSFNLVRSEIKVKMNLMMTCAEFHKYILGKTGVLAAVKSSAKYADVEPPQPR